MKEKKEEQEFTEEERKQILEERFTVKYYSNGKTEQKTLQQIIDGIHYEDKDREFVRKVLFKKQIEDWKKENNINLEPSDEELRQIVKGNLTEKIVRTIFALQRDYKFDKYYFLKDDNDIYFCEYPGNYHLFDINLSSSNHTFPPAKPYFSKKNNIMGIGLYRDYNTISCGWTRKHDDSIMHTINMHFYIHKNKDAENKEVVVIIDDGWFEYKKQYTISLNEEGEVQSITKEGEDNNNKDYKDEIKKLLYEEDLYKHLIENIELELDEEQRQVWSNIRKHLGVDNEENKIKEESEKEGEEDRKLVEKEYNDNKKKNINGTNNNKGYGEDKEKGADKCNCPCLNNLTNWCANLCKSRG